MIENSSDREERKPYERPTVTRFPLRPEEAVLGYCKTSSSGGPYVNPCDSGLGCQSAGS